MNNTVLYAIALGASLAAAQVAVTEVVSLPTAAAWGGGDTVGSLLIGRTYNAGEGPGIWIVADGGYRLYLNGDLLAQDNQAGRVAFVPMTFLPGTNAIAVVGVDGNATPGVLVQIDELEKTYGSGSGWKVSTSASDNTWKNKTYSDASWTAATASGSASTMPSGTALSGFASGSTAKWIWASGTANSQVVLRYTFTVKAEGFGAATTGGDGGSVVVASDSASIRKALQSSTATTILVPEGTYDFRLTRTEYKDQGSYNWCTRSCNGLGVNTSNTYYRITFDGTCGTGESVAASISRWDNWIPIKANKSLVGMGRGANLRGASIYMRGAESASNGIFRNLAIYDVNPHLIEANDGLSTDNTSKLWIDHVSYKWISDGMDLGGSTGTTEATVSWMEYDGSNDKNCYGNDPYVALVENAELTYANNYWRNTSGRVPKVTSDSRASKVHMYNNYVDSNTFFVVGVHGASTTLKSEVLLENNYLKNAKGYPTMKEPYGYINSTGNTWAGTTGTHQLVDASGNRTASVEPTDAVFTPSYTYTKRTVANLPSENLANTGVGGRWGSMPTYTQAMGQSNKAPTVALTSPTAGASYASPASLALTATASDADGSIASVAFYVGNTLVGTDASSPYSVTVASVPAGTFSLVAVATDNSGLKTTSAFVTVAVAGAANTAPVITSASAVTVSENDASKFVVKLAATDTEGGALTCTTTGGDDQALFLLGSSSCNLYFAKVKDYEAPIDADANNVYKVTVQVADTGGLVATQNLVVTVANVNEAPVFSTADTLSVPENTSAVGTVSVADPEGTLVTYSLVTSSDSPLFTLGSTGALLFVHAPDFESPLDSNKDNAYSLVVQASDGLLSSLRTLYVVVSDVAENVGRLAVPALDKSLAGGYAVYALDGSPLYRGFSLPKQMPQSRVVVVQYGLDGRMLRTWVESQTK